MNLGVSLAYISCYAIVTYGISPIQSLIFPEISIYGSLVYLPSGIKLVAIMLFLDRALPALFVSEFFCNLVLWGAWDTSTTAIATLASIASYFGTVIVFRHLGVSVVLEDTLPKMPKTGHIIAVSITASAINGIMTSAVFDSLSIYIRGSVIAITYLIGDVLGTMIAMLILFSIFTKLNQQSGISGD
jgi:uncharacterized membrane protein